jgi:hypothetical protein
VIPVKTYPIALLAIVLLAACGSEPSEDAAPAGAPDSAAAPAAATTDTAPSAPAPADTQRAVVLAPDAVEITGAGARRIAFGESQASALAGVTAVLGGPAEQGTQPECGAGPLDYANYGAGLQLQFQDGKFVGWFANEGSALRTAAGIGPGSTRAQLKAAYPAATVAETSLGQEFTAGDLYGVLTDATDAGKVQVMFAGINCIFR